MSVLVVGAGPTGLTLACELLRHGVSCRVIDELAEPVTYSKAAVAHTRTMEVFDMMGIGQRLLPKTKVIHGVNLHADHKRVGHVELDGVESRYPFIYGVSQHDTESMLATRFVELGGRIERGKKLQEFTESEAGVRARLVDGETIDAQWIVGCDGAHSTVRKACGFTFEGAPYEERIVQADIAIDFPSPVEDDEIQTFLHPDGPLAMFPLFNDGRYRLLAFLPAGSPELETTVETFQRLVDERGPKGARVHNPAWMVAFRIHHRMTNHYRKGRAFIAGDAAHIHSPAGGQGMNTGIQDAFNLAWKLALVERGAADEALLDSYEAERLPIARGVLATTDAATRGLGTFAGLRNPIAVGLRNQLVAFVTKLDAFRHRVGQNVSMIEVRYRESPIVAQDRTPVLQTNVLSSTATEHPSLSDWVAFGDGPLPGDRAADVALESDERLFDRLRTGRHVALLFDGAAPTEQGYKNLESIARSLEKLRELVDVHVVVPQETRPAQLQWQGSVLLDPHGAIHKKYGARSECLYLIRPDGYVAYRSQPANGASLLSFLQRVLKC
jgi:2-polyprenyl-6-methoxyphenol hydroxylase-like FAD-dependent oxidoreductase